MRKIDIVYEDKDIIVIRKPAGLATQSGKVGQADAVSQLKNHLAGQNAGKQKELYLGVVHRLDQPVEGLLVFAKTKKAAAALSNQLAEGSLNKRYYAVLCGQPSAESGELVDYLRKAKDNRAQVVTGQQDKYKDAKKAVLQYRILETITVPETISLAEIQIETGRFHQIRVQMAHGGMELLGDKKYGGEHNAALSHRVGVCNVMLFAGQLALRHPVTQKLMEFSIIPKNGAFSLFAEKCYTDN